MRLPDIQETTSRVKMGASSRLESSTTTTAIAPTARMRRSGTAAPAEAAPRRADPGKGLSARRLGLLSLSHGCLAGAKHG